VFAPIRTFFCNRLHISTIDSHYLSYDDEKA